MVTESDQTLTVVKWSRTVATGGRVTGGLPSHPTLCICIRVSSCVHFCGSGRRLCREGGGEGGGVCVFVRFGGLLLCFEALEGGWWLCVSTPHTSATGHWLVASSNRFYKPPQVLFYA
jgi:hypothetical protein